MTLSVTGIEGLPLVHPGDDLCPMLLDAIDAQTALRDGDVLVVAQKIVSKAEDRLLRLADVTPSADAVALAAETEKDPRLVQLILDESVAVVRKRPGVLIVRHRLGFVSANAGIDQSNVDHAGGEVALLLPLDPDASAASLHDRILEETGKRVGVVISDSTNRPWRLGTTGIAIGAAGIQVFDDRRGGFDLFGRELKITLVNRADSMATAAVLVMGETTERIPAALIRGFPPESPVGNAAGINRPLTEDLFQ